MKNKKARVNDLATLCISETLIPSLKNFLAGLTTAAGVFSALETELTKLLRRGEMAGDDPKQLHYAMMKKQSENIQVWQKWFWDQQSDKVLLESNSKL